MTLSVTPRLILAEFEKRGLACQPVHTSSSKTVLEFTDSQGHRRYLAGTVADKGSAAACRIADDKLTTAGIAKKIGVPTPETAVYESPEQGEDFLKRYGRVVVKPLDSAHGNGVSVNIDSQEKLRQAVPHARKFAECVLMQQQVSGRDIRLLYIGGKFCAASERRPASVTGDGQRTVRELIETTNSKPDRGKNYQKKYNLIPLTVSQDYLGESINRVPKKGEEVQVVGTANIGSGGAAFDVTDSLPGELVEQGRRLVAELQAGVCGVDFMEGPEGFFLIEVNASPSFGMHHHPHEGKPRDVACDFVDWLLL